MDRRRRAQRTISMGVAFFLTTACGGEPPQGAGLSGEPPASHRTSTLQLEYGETEIIEWGGEGPGLVMLHGPNMSPHMFDDLAARFSSSHHVVAFARRGHGKASRPMGPFGLDDLVGDLEEVLDSLGIPSATLVAHSATGHEITRFAELHPDRVDGLVYLDAHGQTPGNPFANVLVDQPYPPCVPFDSFQTRQACAEDYILPPISPPQFWRELTLDMLSDTLGSPPVNKSYAEPVMSSIGAIMAEYEPDYSAIDAPTLFLMADGYFTRSTADTAWNREYTEWLESSEFAESLDWYAERIKSELPEANIVVVEGAAHDNIYLFESVFEEMRGFLGRAAPTEG